MSETITENPGGFFQKYWKWLLAGSAAILALVFYLKGRAGVAALPSGGIPTTPEPTAAPDLSGVSSAIGQQNQMIAALAGLFQEGQQQTAETLAQYQQDISTAANANRAVAETVTSSNQQVAAAITRSNEQVSKSLSTLTEAVKKPAPAKVESSTASTSISNPVKTVYQEPAFGPALGFGGEAKDPNLAAYLKERAENPIYKGSEVERTKAVIKNRSAAGLDLINQLAYYKKLTGQEYVQ